jgi:hypothetical protein
MSVHRLQESKKKTYTISRIKEKNHTVHEQLTDTIHEQFTNQDDYIHLVSKTYLDHGGPSRGPSAAPPHVDPLLPSLQARQLRLPCPTSLPPSFPLGQAPHVRSWSSNFGHDRPFMESFNQGHFSSWDNQNGCARASSCYPQP